LNTATGVIEGDKVTPCDDHVVVIGKNSGGEARLVVHIKVLDVRKKLELELAKAQAAAAQAVKRECKCTGQMSSKWTNGKGGQLEQSLMGNNCKVWKQSGDSEAWCYVKKTCPGSSQSKGKPVASISGEHLFWKHCSTGKKASRTGGTGPSGAAAKQKTPHQHQHQHPKETTTTASATASAAPGHHMKAPPWEPMVPGTCKGCFGLSGQCESISLGSFRVCDQVDAKTKKCPANYKRCMVPAHAGGSKGSRWSECKS
jgi:hypothetical protein